ncbi:MAG: hypothetical protein Q9M09_00035 [Mariprofundaceae bacterium]|nr:hypothetical protein [Mariprofundaceae bacterium]
MGIYTGKDLHGWSRTALQEVLGHSADYFYQAARGIDHRPVKKSQARKSLGKETTFARDILDTQLLLTHAEALAEKVCVRLEDCELKPKTITLKVKYNDFTQITRSFTQSRALTNLAEIKALLPELLVLTDAGTRAIRLIGITASNFENKDGVYPLSKQLPLGL